MARIPRLTLTPPGEALRRGSGGGAAAGGQAQQPKQNTPRQRGACAIAPIAPFSAALALESR